MEQQALQQMGGMYEHARFLYGVEPVDASPRLQKRIRRRMCRRYADVIAELPAQAAARLSPDVPDGDALAFLKECRDAEEQEGERQKQRFLEAAADLPKDVQNALWERMCEYAPYKPEQRPDQTLVMAVDYGAGLERTLVFENASGLPEEPYDGLFFSQLEKEDGRYRWSGWSDQFEQDCQTPFTLCFTAVRMECRVTRADHLIFENGPWETLRSCATAICNKARVFPDGCNPQERALLPLLMEMDKLYLWPDPSEEAMAFPRLKALFAQYGHTDLMAMVARLESCRGTAKRWNRRIIRLFDRLDRQKYEPMWREIWEAVCSSQAEYPSETEPRCPAALLEQTRRTVQTLMERHGYTGAYPDFVKEGPMRGLRLAQLYGQTYFVGMEKRAVCRVHCEEIATDDRLLVRFMHGTALLRPGETADDVYACTFSAKGRRFFDFVPYEALFSPQADTDDLEQRVDMAVRKAELRPLTKEERQIQRGYDVQRSAISAFFLVLVFAGGLFAVAMTGFMMLLDWALSVCLETPSVIPWMVWVAMLAFSWVGFGGAMGVVTVLAKRK